MLFSGGALAADQGHRSCTVGCGEADGAGNCWKMSDHAARTHEPDFRRYALLIAVAAKVFLCCRDDAKVVLAREDKYREVGMERRFLAATAFRSYGGWRGSLPRLSVDQQPTG